MPQISIIVPIYNVEKYLERCISSILNQSFTDFELLLINDGSTDFSLNICKHFAQSDKRIKVISQNNHGVSSARNQGLKNPMGKYIVFVDSDDYLDLDYLKVLYDLIIQDSIELGICGYFLANEEKVTAHLIGQDLILKKEDLLNKLFSPFYFKGYLWNKIFIKEIIITNHLVFDEEISIQEDLKFCFDYIICIRNGYYKNKALYYYFQRKNSALHFSASENFEERRKQKYNSILTVHQHLLERTDYTSPELRQRINNSLFQEKISYAVDLIARKSPYIELKTTQTDMKLGVLKFIKDGSFPIKDKIYAILILIHPPLVYIISQLKTKLTNIKKYRA